ESVDLKAKMSLKWCCMSGRSAVVFIFHRLRFKSESLVSTVREWFTKS
ncbi:hypothetical protein ISN44_As09g006820, partial [Arabidopsis suecica]